ncbi:MAG: hypothetical protein WC353_00165 [Candidatus Peribacter sp.]
MSIILRTPCRQVRVPGPNRIGLSITAVCPWQDFINEEILVRQQCLNTIEICKNIGPGSSGIDVIDSRMNNYRSGA